MTAGSGSDELEHVRTAVLDSDELVRAVVSGRRRNASVPYRRVELRYVDVRAGRLLQLTAYDETQAHTWNLEPADAVAAVDELLATAYANWYVETRAERWQLRVTKKGRWLAHRAARTATAEVDRSHDRTKMRRLDESDPLFALLGVTTGDGRVKPSRMAKFRQVQDLLAALDPLVESAVTLGPGPDLSADRPLRMVDLGCGNAYLTFAAFRYLTVVRGLPVRGVGVDVKAQARAHNSEIAARLGVADQLTFVEGSIAAAVVDDPPDLVMALHACDTATDDALARAVLWRAPVIVAAPCCHHDIQRQLDTAVIPDPYPLVTRHGILRERLADVLTDSLRATILRLVGYRVEVIEFVDSKHTPRNALIRAVRTGAPADRSTADAYRSLVDGWHVQPALASLLEPAYPVLSRTA
ncbi:MAG TPA: SAM-dependent methyltransferase [Nocardioidaceae bacterium]